MNPIQLCTSICLYGDDNVTFIGAYYNIPKNSSNFYFKADNFSVTKLFTVSKSVDVTNLVKDMYPDDIVVYEEV